MRQHISCAKVTILFEWTKKNKNYFAFFFDLAVSGDVQLQKNRFSFASEADEGKTASRDEWMQKATDSDKSWT